MYAERILSKIRTIAVVTAITFALGFSGCKKPAPVATDATMTAALQSRLTGDSALSTESIQASVQNSIATLNGTVSSDAARALASADAAQIPGIKTVVNNLSVQAPPPAPVAAVAPPPPAPTPTPVKKERPQPYKAKPAPIVRRAPPVEQAAAPQLPPPVTAPAPAPVSRPEPPPAPTFRNITIPSGTVIPVRITQTLDSATTQLGDKFTGTLAADIVIDGLTAIRQGTSVTGRVTDAQEAAHYKGSSLLSIELSSINRREGSLTATSDPYTVQGKGRGKNTAEKIGGGAAVGAILGGIFGGGKGAAIGAAAGGGVGAGANTITKGEQVQIPSESLIRFHLTNSISLRVSTGSNDDSRDSRNADAPSDQNSTPNPVLQPRPDYQPPQ